MSTVLLADMLTYCRPYGSVTERTFIARYIEPLPGSWQDAYGNWHVTTDPGSRVLWSCHTDTVHRRDGRQRIKVTKDRITLHKRSMGQTCLGADDTVGVYLMCEMIHAKVPGHYVFHFGEEVRCLGSSALAEHEATWLGGFDYAIALDRGGTSDIITSQYGQRCCSDSFAWALADALREANPTYAPASGVYTDTAEYASLIPECTNVSVGYGRQHSNAEFVDTAHVARLRAVLCAWTGETEQSLPVDRNPAEQAIDAVSGRYLDEERPDVWEDCEDLDDGTMTPEDRAFLQYLRNR